MINAHFLIGLPEQFQNVCWIYPPKVKDILEDKNYNVYRKIFLSCQEDIIDEYTELGLSLSEVPTPLGYIFTLIKADERLKPTILDGFKFFIHEPVTLVEDKEIVIIGDLNKELKFIKSVDDLRLITEDNYFEFQNKLREALGEKAVEPYNPNENEKIKYFKAKARLRDRVKAKNSKDALTLGSTLAAICCMDFGINPLNIGELSQVAITILIRYYQEKKKYEIDISSLLAGADSKKIKPQNWIRNIEDL